MSYYITYATQCLFLNTKCIQELDRIQSRLLKSAIGINKFCHSSSMLEALKINKISTLIDVSSLDWLRSYLNSTYF